MTVAQVRDSAVRRAILLVGVLGGAVSLSACSSGAQTTVCDNVESLSLAVGTLRGGVDVLSDQVAGDLDSRITDSLVMLESLAVEAPTGVTEKITALQSSLADAQEAFDAVGWDFAAAQSDSAVLDAMQQFDGTDVIANVTTISNYVNGICATDGSIGPTSDGLGTLPAPEISTLPVTDPPTGVADNGSDARALGFEIATAFGITASEDELVCLGTKLQEVVDVSGEQSSTGAYNRQFQAAFDACGIDFTVPAS